MNFIKNSNLNKNLLEVKQNLNRIKNELNNLQFRN